MFGVPASFDFGSPGEAFFPLLPDPPMGSVAWMTAAAPLPNFHLMDRRKKSKDWNDLVQEIVADGSGANQEENRKNSKSGSGGTREKVSSSNDPCSPDKGRKTTKDARHEEHGLRTPQKTPTRLPAGWHQSAPETPYSAVATPKMKKEVAGTPPSGPAMLQKHLRNDIEVALLAKSVPLLSLALCRSHGCGDDHCIHEAVRRQNLKALSFLLESSVTMKVDAHCVGRRALHLAIQQCMSEDDVSYKMLEALLSAGASPDFCAGDDVSLGAPLHIATKRGCLAVVALLLSSGAEPNIKDGNGHTPLHIICRQLTFHPGFVEEKVINLLLAHGACPAAEDNLGHEAGDYAHNLCLRKKLQRASQWWVRRNLMQASGQRDVCEARGASDERVQVPWLLPEIFDSIAGFVVSDVAQ